MGGGVLDTLYSRLYHNIPVYIKPECSTVFLKKTFHTSHAFTAIHLLQNRRRFESHNINEITSNSQNVQDLLWAFFSLSFV